MGMTLEELGIFLGAGVVLSIGGAYILQGFHNVLWGESGIINGIKDYYASKTKIWREELELIPEYQEKSY